MYFICELVMIIILLSSRVVQAILSKWTLWVCLLYMFWQRQLWERGYVQPIEEMTQDYLSCFSPSRTYLLWLLQ